MKILSSMMVYDSKNLVENKLYASHYYFHNFFFGNSKKTTRLNLWLYLSHFHTIVFFNFYWVRFYEIKTFWAEGQNLAGTTAVFRTQGNRWNIYLTANAQEFNAVSITKNKSIILCIIIDWYLCSGLNANRVCGITVREV